MFFPSTSASDMEQTNEKKASGVTIYFPDANGEKINQHKDR